MDSGRLSRYKKRKISERCSTGLIRKIHNSTTNRNTTTGDLKDKLRILEEQNTELVNKNKQMKDRLDKYIETRNLLDKGKAACSR